MMAPSEIEFTYAASLPNRDGDWCFPGSYYPCSVLLLTRGEQGVVDEAARRQDSRCAGPEKNRPLDRYESYGIRFYASDSGSTDRSSSRPIGGRSIGPIGIDVGRCSPMAPHPLLKKEIGIDMQLERFTLKAQEALAAAQQLASSRGNAQIEAEHLLAAMLEQDGGLTVPILERIGVNHHALRGGARPAAAPALHRDGLQPARPRHPDPRRPGSGPIRGRPHEGHVRLHRARAHGPGGQGRLGGGPAAPPRRHPRGRVHRAQGPARLRARRGPQRRGQVPGAQEVRARPHRSRARAASSTR